jgi:hypothetical protein
VSLFSSFINWSFASIGSINLYFSSKKSLSFNVGKSLDFSFSLACRCTVEPFIQYIFKTENSLFIKIFYLEIIFLMNVVFTTKYISHYKHISFSDIDSNPIKTFSFTIIKSIYGSCAYLNIEEAMFCLFAPQCIRGISAKLYGFPPQLLSQ